ncbi:MAG TPA: SDR family NAD(P)-dependent oxidoreductase [Dehalococcoidia bacterium]|nr:SDR family NAD(P)-dependent oxidoreductase [Dehalococcoidia bacterium]
MAGPLSGRVALVTGAGSGIGRAIALRLAQDGANTACTDLDFQAARATALTANAAGDRALAVQLDVTDPASVAQAVASVERELGGIDVLVNNAGWDKIEPFLQSEPETWDRIIAINLKGTFHCCKAVLPGMVERGRGAVVSIASDAGRVGSTGEAVYSATKGGIIAFTKTLARELARHQINVNCICPGPTDTPLLASLKEGNPRLGDALQRAVPWGRLGKPEDIAGAVAFLAGPDAAYITGQTLSVSGGLTMA